MKKPDPLCSQESEMMVLGSMLTGIDSLNIGADMLDDFDFFFNEHKIIFYVLKTLYNQDKRADIHLVCEELKRQDKLLAVGGIVYVVSLAQYAGTSAYMEDYIRILKDKSILRRMLDASREIEKKVQENPSDVSGALEDSKQLLFRIDQSQTDKTWTNIQDFFAGDRSKSGKPFHEELQERQERFRIHGAELDGMASGFIDLDQMISGMGNSNLIILAARPSMGKTSLALNIVEE